MTGQPFADAIVDRSERTVPVSFVPKERYAPMALGINTDVVPLQPGATYGGQKSNWSCRAEFRDAKWIKSS